MVDSGHTPLDVFELPGTYTPEQIQALRSRLKWTQALLAARLGVQLSTVQKWERGAREPTGISVQQLYRLHCQVEDGTVQPLHQPRTARERLAAQRRAS